MHAVTLYNINIHIVKHNIKLREEVLMHAAIYILHITCMHAMHGYSGITLISLITVFVGRCLAAKVFIGKLPATREVWVIMG